MNLLLIVREEVLCHASPAIVAAASETSFCTVAHCSLICCARQ